MEGMHHWGECSNVEGNTTHGSEGEECAPQESECAPQESERAPQESECAPQEHTPYIGMTFKSDDAAYDFYNLHAAELGFGVRRDKTFFGKKRNCITSRTFVCSKQRFRVEDKRISEVPVNRRRATREGCLAMFRVKLREDDIWFVDAFNVNHNHVFVSPSKICELRSQKKLTETSRSLIDSFSRSVGPAKIAEILTNANVIVSSQEIRSYLKKDRISNIGHDCMGVIKSFMDRQAKEDGFFFEAEIDEDFRLRSVFWVNGRARVAYHQFGDVVVFDTTYRTNAYSMPFAPFTGVNHHRQLILLGCALLADETEETFTWLFQTWLKAMGGKKPVSIITDQDGAMAKAIRTVFDSTQHRLCLWHIGQNETRHLSAVKLKHVGFDVEWTKCKYSESVEEFEKRWTHLIVEYGLEENSWLKTMYDLRRHWIPCYMNDTFYAGMSTTQRSESMNSFFDGYVGAKTPLNEFVMQYDKALIHRRNQENHEDYVTLYTNPAFVSMNQLERQAGNVYTRNVFKRFQVGFQKILDYVADKFGEEGHISMYRVGTYGSEKKYIVNFDERDKSVTCACKKFEFEGVLCSHILKVYQKLDVLEIPSKYILTRWTIEARYGHVCRHETEPSDPECVTPVMVWNVRAAGLKSIHLGVQSVEHYNIVMPVLMNVVEKLGELKLSSSNCGSMQGDNMNVDDDPSVPLTEQIRIRDPERSITKGRPKSSVRIRSGLEETLAKAKQRTCGYCKKKGHYISTCPYRKDGDASTS